MDFKNQTIFRKLLITIAGTGLVAALLSGSAHYWFSKKLIEDSVEQHMDTALHSAVSHFDRTFRVPVVVGLQTLESSPIVDSLLMSAESEILLNRPKTERLFISVTNANAGLFDSLRLIDLEGNERVHILDGIRIKKLVNFQSPTAERKQDVGIGKLFRRLEQTTPGTILWSGPFKNAAQDFYFLGGISKREPEIGGFGGAIIGQIDLGDYLRYLSMYKIFEQSMVWLFDASGSVILKPSVESKSPDPTPYLLNKKSELGNPLVRMTDHWTGTDMLGIFTLVFSMSPTTSAAQLTGAGYIALAVLLATVVLASIIALFLAGQMASPIRSLSAMTEAVGSGNLQERVPEKWGGELGQLANAFNKMLDSLEQTTVSTDYVNNIIQSMTNTVIVIGTDHKIHTVNRALLELLQKEEHDLIGEPLNLILNDSELHQKIIDPDDNTKNVINVETTYRAANDIDISVSFSCSALLDNRGDIQGFVCVAQNITERKRAENELQEQNNLFESIFNHVPDALIISDTSRNISMTNFGFKHTFGYEQDEVIGKSASIVYESEQEYNRLGDRRFNVDAIKQFTPEIGSFRRKDGDVFPVEVVGAPIRDTKGVVIGYIGLMRDITDRRRAELALRESEERFRGLIDLSSDWYWEQDDQFRFTLMSQGITNRLGVSTEEHFGKTRWELSYVDVPDEVWEKHKTDLELHKPFYDLELKRLDPQGNFHYVSNTGKPFFDETGKFLGYRGVASDITERKHAEERIEYLATRDSLTDLPNRLLLNDRLNQAILEAERESEILALIFIDLDNFKAINDSLGHHIGDMLLVEVAERLRDCVRKGDTLSRLGGDEFVLILRNIKAVQDAAHVAQKILDVVSEPYTIEDHLLGTTGSVGISIFPDDGKDVLTLMKNADTAMYHSKDKGRNSFQFFTHAMNINAVERLTVEIELRNALQNQEFELYYQPQYSMVSNQVVGIEALIRWHHPEKGMVLPGNFIAIAEDTGLIVPIGEWVFREACEQNKAWQDAGLPAVPIAVNLSAHQFLQQNLLTVIKKILDDTNLGAQFLELELTESALMHHTEEVIETLENLNALNLRMAIDDFGTGYSSLGYLKRFPIDRIKIDRSFISDVTRIDEDAAITQTIVNLAHGLNIKVTAEGIESLDQYDLLRSMDCDEGQGYFFSKPLPLKDITALLHKSQDVDINQTDSRLSRLG